MPINTDQLLEQWNLDAEALAQEVAARITGEHDLLYGGSLADDLGDLSSDVDLYCFTTSEVNQIPSGLVLIPCGPTMIELNVVDVHSAVLELPDLRLLLTDPRWTQPHEWPLLTGTSLRIFHAIYCDRLVSGNGSMVEQVRRSVGADLLHLYVALRATYTAAALMDDVRRLSLPEQVWAALYSARLGAEAALDAALATVGQISPNAKWRVLLTERAGQAHEDFPRLGDVVPALFCGDSDPVQGRCRCLKTVRDCLRIVERDTLLSSFHAVREACEELDSLIAETPAFTLGEGAL